MRTILERQMAELAIGELPDALDLERRLQEAQDLADDSREALATARAALQGPEEEQGRLKTELGSAEARYKDGGERLQKLRQILADVEVQAADDVLEAAIAVARAALVDQQKVVSELEMQRAGETLPQLAARIGRLEKAIHDRREKRSDLKERIAGLRSHVEALEGAGLDEAIQQKARELELGEEQKQRLEREVKILTLLLSTLREAEKDAKERYLSPVLNRVRPYLQLLFPGAEITIDEDLHIVGVIREAGYEEAFHHLSMGTQEQIAVLVRLAFAEMLVEQGHPAAVILDDALVFSDDRRMSSMFDILNMVARQVQIIVLTCREQLFEGVGGHHVSLQPISEKDLESA
jgi:uncharacterized protein YhaN